MAVDPVCGMKVKEDTDLVFEYDGKKFYFCCSGCLDSFKLNPLKYTR